MTTPTNLNLAVVGLGKMGLSHFAIANATDGIDVVAISEKSTLLSQLFQRYIKVDNVSDYTRLVAMPGLSAVIVATPTRTHYEMSRQALENGLHVFCEKPMTLSSSQSESLAAMAMERALVGQVGYHNRFIASFAEARRLIESGAIGRVRHVNAEAYGPVVLKPTAATWRSNPEEGGGCLYDYAAHPINLLNWYVGRPVECIGASLTQQYSNGVDDAVHAELRFTNGVTAQVSVNWCDDSVRKMTTKMTVWGDGGRINVDRQELQLFTNGKSVIPEGYNKGWTVKYITELTPNVNYYLRGEEYSAQIEGFLRAIQAGDGRAINNFSSAAETDYTLELIRARAFAEPPPPAALGMPTERPRSRGMLARVLGR